MAPEEETAVARAYLEELRLGTGNETYERLSPQLLAQEGVADLLAQLAKGMPDGEPTDFDLVRYQWSSSGKGSFWYFIFEYNFDGSYYLADITLVKGEDEESFLIHGLHLNQTEGTAWASSGLPDFSDAGALHYAFAGLIVVIPLFVLTSFVVCLLTKGLRLKWLWCIGIFIGLSSFTLVWNTGELHVSLLNLKLFSAGFLNMGDGWQLSVGIPFFAIAFWFKRRQIRKLAAAADAVPKLPTDRPPPPPAN